MKYIHHVVWFHDIYFRAPNKCIWMYKLPICKPSISLVFYAYLKAPLFIKFMIDALNHQGYDGGEFVKKRERGDHIQEIEIV